MCGRFSQRTPAAKLAETFGVEAPAALPLRFNVAPTQDVAVVRADEAGARRLDLLRWGLIPSWAKDAAMGNKLINARSETVTEKPSFRDAFRLRRCLVPADGFYEWQRRGAAKRPFYFQVGGGEPFAIAGLWERWPGGDEGPLETVTLLTTEANDMLRPVHDRMPVILAPESYQLWLDPAVREPELLRPLLRPYPAQEMTAHQVSTLVNNPANDDPRCVEAWE